MMACFDIMCHKVYLFCYVVYCCRWERKRRG